MFSTLLVLVQVALRNLAGSLLSLFVGSIIFFGTVLLVVGGSVFDTLDKALSKSIVGSVTAHLQLYSASSKDELQVYGKFDGSDTVLAPITNFKEVKQQLLGLSNVARVVPMGTSGAMLGSGNTIDLTLEKLRGLYREQAEGRSKLSEADFKAQSQSKKDHVRQIVQVLLKDSENIKELQDEGAADPAEKEALLRASSEEFWQSFDQDPFGHLEFLENRLAPLIADADLLFIRFLGTDLEEFQATFDRMEIVDGTRVPEGKRGILIPKFFYEEYMKLKSARRLDKIRDALDAGRKISDQGDTELQRFIKENLVQTREFVLQLDTLKTQVAVEKLQKHLGSQSKDFAALLQEFFAVTDENFARRYAFFYEELAPMLDLYRVRVGDNLHLTSFGKSGGAESVSVRVYGTFHFKGLEKSPLSGALALLDMMSFRDLYGFLSSDRAAELEAMKKEVNAKQVTRENAEDELFGGSAEVVSESASATIEEKAPANIRGRARQEADARSFTREQIDDGVVLHVAVQLKDASRLAAAATRREIEALLARATGPADAQAVKTLTAAAAEKKVPGDLLRALQPVLDAEARRAAGQGGPAAQAEVMALAAAFKLFRGHLPMEVETATEKLLAAARPPLWVVDWDAAAGVLGQFIGFFKLALVGITTVVGLIAVIILMIGITIATLQRTQTIGTIRAIGGQREFVLAMVVVESLVLSAIFATLGIAVGAGIVQWLGATGIPAFRDELYFFFSGPKLLPQLSTASVATAVVLIVAATLVSVLVPALIATRISPLRAMQASE